MAIVGSARAALERRRGMDRRDDDCGEGLARARRVLSARGGGERDARATKRVG